MLVNLASNPSLVILLSTILFSRMPLSQELLFDQIVLLHYLKFWVIKNIICLYSITNIIVIKRFRGENAFIWGADIPRENVRLYTYDNGIHMR